MYNAVSQQTLWQLREYLSQLTITSTFPLVEENFKFVRVCVCNVVM